MLQYLSLVCGSKVDSYIFSCLCLILRLDFSALGVRLIILKLKECGYIILIPLTSFKS